jgi:hypothetical protein
LIYDAILVSAAESIEEEVELEVLGLRLVCFAGVCPFRLEPGLAYRVDLGAFVINDREPQHLPEGEADSIERIGESFSYLVSGQVDGSDLLSRGILFEGVLDEVNPTMKDTRMRVWIDRLDVEFLNQP